MLFNTLGYIYISIYILNLYIWWPNEILVRYVTIRSWPIGGQRGGAAVLYLPPFFTKIRLKRQPRGLIFQNFLEHNIWILPPSPFEILWPRLYRVNSQEVLEFDTLGILMTWKIILKRNSVLNGKYLWKGIMYLVLVNRIIRII